MKIRKSVKTACIVISIILCIISCYNLINVNSDRGIISSKKAIYSYKNKFNYSYDVTLKDNKFMETKYSDKSKKNYVTDLIDNLELNLNYNYEGSLESDISYKYKIVGKINGVYSKDGEEVNVWEKEYTLKDETSNSKKSNNINIKEKLNLNLSEQNALVKEFQDELQMSLNTNYVVMLIVNTETTIDGEKVENEYTSSVAIDLGQKVTAISGENNLEKEDSIAKEVTSKEKSNIISIIVNGIILIASVCLFVFVIRKETVNIVKNDYKQELNRILRLCQDKIVEASTNPIADASNIVDVKDFGEMIKVSEELFKPILYWYSDNDEAEFSVISNNMVYRYILKK